MIGQRISVKQRAEFDARDFHEEAQWKTWKREFDSLMAFRKTLNGKPDAIQLEQIKANAIRLDFLGFVLWHSAYLQSEGKCPCTRCASMRNGVGV